MKRFISLVLTVIMFVTLTACHGAKEKNVFQIPENFDETQKYEFSFWAKNDTYLTQVEIYKKAIADF